MLDFNAIMSGLIIVITSIIFGRIIINKKIQIKYDKIILFAIVMSCCYILTYFYLEGLGKTIFSFLLYMVIFKYIYKTTYKKTIFSVFIFITILMFADLIVLFFITSLKLEKVIGTLLGNLLVNLVALAICCILKKPLRKILKIEIEDKTKIIILSLITFFCIVYFFYNFVSAFELNNNFISSLVVIVFFLITLIVVIKQTLDNNKLKLEYDKLLDFMKTYEVEIEKQHIQHHESKNQLVTIKAKLLDQENNKNVIEYIDSILDENISINQTYYAKFQYLPSNGLKALFYFKASEAENKGITVTISISPKIKNSLLNNLSANNFKQLGRIIGVYLDNAIEASSLSNSKSMGIEVYKEDENIKIIITNSFDGEIDEKVGNTIFSTKGKNRGHGLMLVNSIINNNNMFYQKREIRKNVYVQILVVKNKKSI